MKPDLKSLKAALANVAPLTVKATGLVRLVPQLDLGESPDWLFTSGKANRYNPAGVECVYFAGTRDIAQAEYDGYWKGLPGRNQPVTTYFAEVKLRRVLDLTEVPVLKALGLENEDLYRNWRTARLPTLTQLLGRAVNETRIFSAIRYPSKAAADLKHGGNNFVIFRDCVRAPDFVRILGPDSKPLQKWP